MAEKLLGSNFILGNWEVIAKFSYDHFLQHGFGAVVISDEDDSLDNLSYILSSNLLAAINGGDLVNTDGKLLARVESLAYDSWGNPRISIDTEIQRKQLDEFLQNDPDYRVLYLRLSGGMGKLGLCGKRNNCPARIHNLERTPEIEYFHPEILLDDDPVIDRMEREHYSQHLQAMAEPVLSCIQEQPKEIYRFLWLRTFRSPLAIRVEKDPSGYAIVTKELNGCGGYYPKGLSKQISGNLTVQQWEQVISLIEKSRFWRASTFRSSRFSLQLDGAEWVLEGYRNQKYHAITRLGPNGADIDFRKACLYLLELSGLKIPDSEVY
jgi:hypothetical protein